MHPLRAFLAADERALRACQFYPISMRTSAELTINIQSGGTCDHSCQICSNTRVLSFKAGENSGNLQQAGVIIMRHPEDVRLFNLSVIAEPRNLQIWRESVFS